MKTILVKAVKSRRYLGWYGYYRGDSRLPFTKLENAAGQQIIYKTKQGALDAAAEHARVDRRIYER